MCPIPPSQLQVHWCDLRVLSATHFFFVQRTCTYTPYSRKKRLGGQAHTALVPFTGVELKGRGQVHVFYRCFRAGALTTGTTPDLTAGLSIISGPSFIFQTSCIY